MKSKQFFDSSNFGIDSLANLSWITECWLAVYECGNHILKHLMYIIFYELKCFNQHE